MLQKEQVSIGLPVGLRRKMTARPTVISKLQRLIDQLITGLQEWLEQDDTAAAKGIAYGIIFAAAVYLAASVVRVLI